MAKLKVDKASGDPVPHKPLLLLVVLELAEQPEESQKQGREARASACAWWRRTATPVP
jgi:hypothetical protein